MSEARKRLDWNKMFELAMDPEKARRYRAESKPEKEDTCSMCGNFCAVKNTKPHPRTAKSSPSSTNNGACTKRAKIKKLLPPRAGAFLCVYAGGASSPRFREFHAPRITRWSFARAAKFL